MGTDEQSSNSQRRKASKKKKPRNSIRRSQSMGADGPAAGAVFGHNNTAAIEATAAGDDASSNLPFVEDEEPTKLFVTRSPTSQPPSSGAPLHSSASDTGASVHQPASPLPQASSTPNGDKISKLKSVRRRASAAATFGRHSSKKGHPSTSEALSENSNLASSTAGAMPARAGAKPASRSDHLAHSLYSSALRIFKGVNSDSHSQGGLSYGAAVSAGRRAYNEDRHVAVFDLKAGAKVSQSAVFGVFDGHGGWRASQYCIENIPARLRAGLQKGAAEANGEGRKGKKSGQPQKHEEYVPEALRRAFERVDAEFSKTATRYLLDDGTTAVVAYIREGFIYCANAGDSRCILSRNAMAVELSFDHKPNRPDERRRVESLGGFIKHLGVWRCMGVLAVSRAIGDVSLKPYVIPTPDVTITEIGPTDEFIVIASDGLWDVMTNQEVVDFLHVREKLIAKPELAAKALVTEGYRRGSFDNITAVVVTFRGLESS